MTEYTLNVAVLFQTGALHIHPYYEERAKMDNSAGTEYESAMKITK